jgi:hypothetical protein
MKGTRDIEVIEGSGNVFADPQIKEPEEVLIKAELAHDSSGAHAKIGGSAVDSCQHINHNESQARLAFQEGAR